MRTFDRMFTTVASMGLVIAGIINAANAAGDPAKGQQVFAKCAPCHATDKSNRAGPGLLGIVGRQAGSVQVFHYSRAMKAAKIAKNATTMSLPKASSQAARTVSIAANCR